MTGARYAVYDKNVAYFIFALLISSFVSLLLLTMVVDE